MEFGLKSDIFKAVRYTNAVRRMFGADRSSGGAALLKAILVIGQTSNESPYTNTRHHDDINSLYDDGAHVSVVCIEHFFTDGQDFAFFVAGRQNVTAFAHGAFGMQAYNGPLRATPITSRSHEILGVFKASDRSGGKVPKSSSHMEKVKWRYLFETARVAWSKLKVSLSKLGMMRARRETTLSREEQIGQILSAD
jgi:hypothetical protein